MEIKKEQRIERLRTFTRLMDSSIAIPGTQIRFGLDVIIGLIPGGGDILTAVMSSYTLWVALKLGVPKWTLLRMLLNIFLDVLIGILPFIGDIIDIFWKSNTRNLALLEASVHNDELTEQKSKSLLIIIVIALIIWNIALLLLFLWLFSVVLSMF